jgi:hypothetical protein
MQNTTITEEELARIDAANDEYRRVFISMTSNGWAPDAVRCAYRRNRGIACPDTCIPCRNDRAHGPCYGCPDC